MIFQFQFSNYTWQAGTKVHCNHLEQLWQNDLSRNLCVCMCVCADAASISASTQMYSEEFNPNVSTIKILHA